MGVFETGGIAAEMSRFDKLIKGTEAACTAAVQAGAAVLAERLREAAPVDTGALSKSVKAGKVAYDPGNGYSSTVTPKGKHHGEDLAKIGNILEYGDANGRRHRPWFAKTVDAAESEVVAAIEQAFANVQEA